MLTKELMKYMDWKILLHDENGFNCKKPGQIKILWMEIDYTYKTEEIVINRVTKIRKKVTKEKMYQGICSDVESFCDIFRLHKYK
jgi:hypothetical protein